MTYLELRKKQDEEFNAFPKFFAFSDEQFKEGLKQLGVKKDEVVYLAAGGYLRRSDIKAYDEMNKRHREEFKEACKNINFVVSMFYYELNNHEYSYTQDVSETLLGLGISEKALEENPILQEGLQKAIDKINALEEARREREREEERKQEVENVSNMINKVGFSPKDFCKRFLREHRAIQADFTHLCITWLKMVGSDDYKFDDRNKRSHEIAKMIKDFLEERGI